MLKIRRGSLVIAVSVASIMGCGRLVRTTRGQPGGLPGTEPGEALCPEPVLFFRGPWRLAGCLARPGLQERFPVAKGRQDSLPFSRVKRRANMYRTDLVLNRNFHPGPPTARSRTSPARFGNNCRGQGRGGLLAGGTNRPPWSGLDGRAAASGIARLWCKQEGPRFGIGSFKPTGPTYAMLTVLRGEIQKAAGVRHVPTRELLDGRFAAAAAGVTVCAATSGNHGRALAWGARMFGCRCIIYMNDKVSKGREAVIASFGAEVVRVPGSFDRAVQRSFEDAEENGYFVICDRQRRYPEVPLRIIQGYALVGEEIASQLPLPEAPTHLFVPGGSGKLASAVCARLWERYGDAHPRVVTVEPEGFCLPARERPGRQGR